MSFVSSRNCAIASVLRKSGLSGRTDTAIPMTIFPRSSMRGEKHIRSEEHTSELQSLMRISYAVFCLNKKKTKIIHKYDNTKAQTQYYKNKTDTNQKQQEPG